MQIEKWLDSQLGVDIWKGKYEYQNEGFDAWLNRISNNNEELKQLILDKKFLFGGRILANRGLQNKGVKVTYSNCYVIPEVEDNIESIFDTAKLLARTFSYGGGCGIDISNLAPKNAKVNNTARNTTGSVSFMDLYSLTTELIGQFGRRGALMISILCTHPDLLDFIDIKNNLDKVTKANISIRILDDFMNAVKNDSDWTLSFYRKETDETVSNTYKAREIYKKICYNNWNMAEPGMLFWDRISNYNLISEDNDFKYAGVNPCAEEPLPAGGSCLLGSINLSEFVKNPFTEDCYFDYEDFKNTVRIAVTSLNEVLDEGLPLHPLEIQKQTVGDWRQIGLGIMGLNELFVKMGIRYGSEESVKLSDDIGFCMANESILTSSKLAKKYGVYPKYKKDIIFSSKYFLNNTTDETKQFVLENGLYNSQILTIAPTGTLSTMLGISGGIEPMYNISYTRKTESLHGKDVFYKVYTPIVKEYMERFNIEDEEGLPKIFETAMTLNYKERINMQSAWQSHIDASISSTVNVHHEFTVEEVEDLYMYAWEKGLKGITIYRDGCARSGILTNNTKSNDTEDIEELKYGQWKPKAEDTIYFNRKVNIGCGKLKLMIGWSETEKQIQDLYIIRSGNGGCEKNLQGMVIAMSGMLRLGGNIFNVEKAFEGIGTCNSFISSRLQGKKISKGTSCGSAILNEIKTFLKERECGTVEIKHMKKEETNKNTLTDEEKEYLKNNGEIEFAKHFNKCPICGDKLTNSGGCIVCQSCGWSKCS